MSEEESAERKKRARERQEELIRRRTSASILRISAISVAFIVSVAFGVTVAFFSDRHIVFDKFGVTPDILLATLGAVSVLFLTSLNLSERSGSLASFLVELAAAIRLLVGPTDSNRRRFQRVSVQSAAVSYSRSGRVDFPDFLANPKSYIDILVQFRKRMYMEERRLRRNSVYNLSWGIAFSFFSLILLGYSALSMGQKAFSGMEIFIEGYVPRLSIVLILEITSFFFLRLYSATELEIKHNKNEVTNLETKFVSVLLLENSNKADDLSEVIKRFLVVERNFVLKRGERTIVTENDLRYNDIIEFISTSSQRQRGNGKEAKDE